MPKNRKLTYSDHQSQAAKLKQAAKKEATRKQDSSLAAAGGDKEASKK